MFFQMCDRNEENNTIKNEDYSLLAVCVKNYIVKPIMLILKQKQGTPTEIYVSRHDFSVT